MTSFPGKMYGTGFKCFFFLNVFKRVRGKLLGAMSTDNFSRNFCKGVHTTGTQLIGAGESKEDYICRSKSMFVFSFDDVGDQKN